jgi:hypothetical protein
LFYASKTAKELSMPEQPRDPLHYEMKIPPEPDQATLKKEDLKKLPPDDENRDAASTAKDANVVERESQRQSGRDEK